MKSPHRPIYPTHQLDPALRARWLIHDAGGSDEALVVAREFERAGTWHGVVDAIIDHIAAVERGCI